MSYIIIKAEISDAKDAYAFTSSSVCSPSREPNSCLLSSDLYLRKLIAYYLNEAKIQVQDAPRRVTICRRSLLAHKYLIRRYKLHILLNYQQYVFANTKQKRKLSDQVRGASRYNGIWVINSQHAPTHTHSRLARSPWRFFRPTTLLAVGHRYRSSILRLYWAKIIFHARIPFCHLILRFFSYLLPLYMHIALSNSKKRLFGREALHDHHAWIQFPHFFLLFYFISCLSYIFIYYHGSRTSAFPNLACRVFSFHIYKDIILYYYYS